MKFRFQLIITWKIINWSLPEKIFDNTLGKIKETGIVCLVVRVGNVIIAGVREREEERKRGVCSNNNDNNAHKVIVPFVRFLWATVLVIIILCKVS